MRGNSSTQPNPMDALRTLLTIARTALDGAEAMLPPESVTHAEVDPPKPARKVKRKSRRKLVRPEVVKSIRELNVNGSPKTGKRGRPKGSRTFECDDCHRRFTTMASDLDAVCRFCESVHVRPSRGPKPRI